MTRAIRCTVAFAVAWSLQAGVSFASADYLDHLSGPGPFGGFDYSYRFLCMTNTGDQPDFGTIKDATGTTIAERAENVNVRLRFGEHGSIPLLWSRFDVMPPDVKPEDRTADTQAARRRELAKYFCHNDQYIRAYLAATYRHNGNDKHSAFFSFFNLLKGDTDKSPVQIETFEVGYVRRVGPFDFGETFGLNYLHGAGFSSFWRASATPAVGFSPFAILSEGRAARSVTFWIAGHTFFQGFDSSDFCRKDANGNKQIACEGITPFHTPTEIVPRFSLVINPALWRKRP